MRFVYGFSLFLYFVFDFRPFQTIVIFWPYIDNLGLSRWLFAQIWYLVLILSYDTIDVLFDDFMKKMFLCFENCCSIPPSHCTVWLSGKKNKISNANIPHLECQKPTLTSIYNTIGDKTVILGCTKKFSISKSLKKENLYSYTYILTTN